MFFGLSTCMCLYVLLRQEIADYIVQMFSVKYQKNIGYLSSPNDATKQKAYLCISYEVEDVKNC